MDWDDIREDEGGRDSGAPDGGASGGGLGPAPEGDDFYEGGEGAAPPPPRKKPRKKIRIPPDPVPGRLERLRERMDREGVRSALVKTPENRRYFSGFKAPDSMLTESSGCLVISLSGRNLLLTDSRYTSAAKREAPLFEVVTCQRGAAQALREQCRLTEPLSYEPHYVTVAELKELGSHLGAENVLPLPFKLGDFRVVKDPDEIHLVRRAVAITEKSLTLLWAELEPGVSENWCALFLENKFRQLGAEGAAFPSIVASGANGALPHAEPSNKKFGKTEMTVIDIGARYKGYCSDMTRTYMPARPLDWQKEIYRVVRDAQLKAIDFLKPGVTGREVDKRARNHIAAKGWGDCFSHSLGHGVGLLVHEEPRLSPHSEEKLPPGALVTVEPGIYIPGRGGVRLEQLCLITEDGCQVLNKERLFYHKF
jgi:Xaa-Pro aminopeptidase